MYKRLILWLCILLAIPCVSYGQNLNITASNAVVIDMASGSVLYEKNKDNKTSMASTTKIMTVLIACEMSDFDSVVTITNEMLKNVEGSSIYLKVGDKITVEDLVKGAMLASGNDCANSLAVFIGESIENFVVIMNNYAQKIGMRNSHFETPSGLDSAQHYSTAYDMALLTATALKNERFSSICKLQSSEITVSDKTQTIYNHNKLLSTMENCIGVKTGFTKKSGRCLVSAYDFKNSTIIVVTLNDYDDWNDHKKLYEYAKSRYLICSKNYYTTLNVVGSNAKLIKCGAKYDYSYLADIEVKAYYYPFVYAPIIKNSKVGYLTIYSNNVKIGTVDIIALESVKVWQTTK